MKKCLKREECESRYKKWLIIEYFDNFRYFDIGVFWLIILVVRGFFVFDLYCGYIVYIFLEDIKKNIKICIRGLLVFDFIYFYSKFNDKNKKKFVLNDIILIFIMM